jgi:hypothetical protein
MATNTGCPSNADNWCALHKPGVMNNALALEAAWSDSPAEGVEEAWRESSGLNGKQAGMAARELLRRGAAAHKPQVTGRLGSCLATLPDPRDNEPNHSRLSRQCSELHASSTFVDIWRSITTVQTLVTQLGIIYSSIHHLVLCSSELPL